ncbi:MAG: MATE family efflux transporter [Candidatus Bathyarchaeia archaeon]
MSDESSDTQETYKIGKYRDKIVNGPIIRTLLWLGAPPLLNQLIVVAYNVADVYWLSLYSEITVAVPRQAWPVIMLFQALINALTAACLSIVSQYIGAKNYRDASVSASRFFTLAFFSGMALSVTLLTVRGFIFTQMISTPPEILEDVMKYSGVIAFDIFFNYTALTYTTLLQSLGDTRRPAIVNSIAICVNTALDPLLVLGLGPFPRLGVIGASLTDVIGKIISTTTLACITRREYPDLKVGFTRDVDIKWIYLVLRIGLPILALGLMNSLAFLLQLRIVNLLGIVAATAYAIGFTIMDIVDAALWGLSGATGIMVGQNLGAENVERAKEVAYKSALLIAALTAIGACVVYPLRRSLADVFADDPCIITETDLFLQTLVPTLPFFGIFIVAMATGRGSGHTVFPTVVGMLRLWGIRIGLGYFLAFNLGMGSFGAWLAISLSNIVGGVVSMVWIKYGRWAEAVVRENRKE